VRPELRYVSAERPPGDLLLCRAHPAIAPQDPRPTLGWDVHALLCGAYHEAVMQAKLPAADQYADGVEKHPLTVSNHELLLGFLAIAVELDHKDIGLDSGAGDHQHPPTSTW
jgi:hypothetical protein